MTMQKKNGGNLWSGSTLKSRLPLNVMFHRSFAHTYTVNEGGREPPNCARGANDTRKGGTMSGIGLHHLPRDMKLLWIRGYDWTWNISNFMGLEELEELWITGCDEVSALGGNGGQPEGQPVERTQLRLYLKKLQYLGIYDCEGLESIIGAATDEEEYH
ncbi:hypothetical protein CRG98_028616 [Punica granatum]|uniref:Uncharacterized protein n=1 Tax=Punica granatum TaxID=22663 RepID=A0A2I0J431_PUNGR|nr:hypothetical protein CRG98_028616 [Punica granatum]